MEVKERKDFIRMRTDCNKKIKKEFSFKSVLFANFKQLIGRLSDMHYAARLHNLVFQKTPGGNNYFFFHIHNRGVINRCIAKLEWQGQVSPCMVSR